MKRMVRRALGHVVWRPMSAGNCGSRAAGKWVFAYLVSGSGRDYFVATAAHRIYVDPAGGLHLVGMSATATYFRGALELVGVSPQFERIAEWKSAPEQFTEAGPTPAAARMRGELYDALWARWLTTVAEARGLTVEQVRAAVDAGPYTAGALARDRALVDAVAEPDQVGQLVATALGGALPVGRPTPTRPARWALPGVAVIYVDGDITDGRSLTVPILDRAVAGGQALIEAIGQARADPRIGAIVLRIDSPGGSALASELVAREVFATRGVKPIVCSLGDVAASGGYFIAAGCDAIFAEPMTITGSIGIFSGKFDVSGLARRLGVTLDTERRGQRAELDSMFRPYTDDERAVVRGQLAYSYGRFVGAVAEGRGLTRDAVDAVGRGHVWTGAQAQPLHLVDRLGGLGDALVEARQRIGLAADADLELIELPRRGSVLGPLGELLGVSAAGAPVWPSAIAALLAAVPASILVAPTAPQARLPFDVIWE